MTVVTIEEAREQLPDLLRRAGAGEKIVIADGGKWLAALATPPTPPPTAEEEAAQVTRAEEQVRESLGLSPAIPMDRETVQRWLDEQRR